jgi:competence ComEA-like helix-hairpin-helix protein
MLVNHRANEMICIDTGCYFYQGRCSLALCFFYFKKEFFMKRTMLFFALSAVSASLLLSTPILAARSNAVKVHRQGTHQSSLISINHSSAAQLAQLKGLGVKKAQAIVHYRQSHGSFKNIDDLVNVKGVGLALLKKIKRKNTGQFSLN